MKSLIKKYCVFFYFVFAYIFSWIIGIPLAIGATINRQLLPSWTHYIYSFGPFLSAVLVIGLSQGRTGVGDLIKRIRLKHTSFLVWLAAFSPLLLFFFFSVFNKLFFNVNMNLIALGNVKFLPELNPFAAFSLWLFTFGFGEEMGWRAFALPKLQEKYSLLHTTIFLSIFWAGWHIPQYFYSYEVSMLPGWLISIFAGTIIFTWLYNKSKGNILPAIIFHTCYNYISASEAGESIPSIMVTGLIVLGAAIILWRKFPLWSKKKEIILNKQDA